MKSSIKLLDCFLVVLFYVSTIAWASVKPGVDQLFEPTYLKQLKNQRLGLITNLSSHDSQGKRTLDILIDHPELDVRTIFSLEHGLAMLHEGVVSKQPRYRQVPVLSLYGRKRKPSADALDKVDVIIFDLQDTGMRFYTYISTLALVMVQAARYHKKVMVLDRPNPQGGRLVTGALVDKSLQGDFIAYYPIPMQYGLTIGELARYYQRYFGIDVDLTVVPMKHWKRYMRYQDTQLKWISPSPALVRAEQALAYSVLGPLEALQLSVGRGQTNQHAFVYYGAPFISSQEAAHLVAALQQLDLPGLAFSAVTWTADRAKFKGKLCRGFAMKIKDAKKIRPFYSFILVAQQLYRQFGDKLQWQRISKWLGEAWVLQAIKQIRPVTEILMRAQRERESFMQQRRTVLLYN